MNRKNIKTKIKKVITPLAFILIIILSAFYKFVLKGSGDFSISAFKNGRRASVTESAAPETTAEKSETESAQTSVTPTKPKETVQLISVYICGEVNKPGIYEAPKGVMLNDIIEDAGGLTDDASVNNINFVYQITGNMSIYIPSKEEIEKGFNGGDIIRQEGVYVWGNNGQSSGSDTGSTKTLMVNINTATVDELRTLPGIGEVTAQTIVDYRNKTPFKKIEDIKNVTGIGDSKYNRIKDYICV